MTSKEKEIDHRQNPIQAKASASGSVAPSSPYRGTGYRSVAFGTWAVGDASRRFAERKRGRSSGGGQCEKSQHTNDEENSHERKPRECEATGPLSSHSVGDIRPNSCATTTTVTMSMTERLTRRADLYSSSEYVRHSAGGNYDENVSMAASLPPLACCNRSMETLTASNYCAFNAASPVPSRISCPSSRPRFAFIVDPLKAANRPQHQQQGDADTPPMRNRTKSLDNGLKFSSTPQRARKVHRYGNSNNNNGSSNASIEPTIRKANDSFASQQQHSRLEQAKQFLRRFYTSSTLRLAGRKRRTMLAANETTNTRVEPNGALMFSSAVGPFFEFRPPCPEELPLLPYNIHYAVHSADCSDDSDQEEDESQAVYPPGSSCCPVAGDHSTATLTPAGGSASCSSSSSSPTSHYQSARTSSSSGLGISTTAASALPILDTSTSRSMQKCADSPDSALGGSPPGSAGSGHPTAIGGSHSLQSSDSGVASGRKHPADTTAQNMASAERRFSNWNELFQYLRREIIEMNVRDAQILHRLEGIQSDLNGVRQLQRHMQGR